MKRLAEECGEPTLTNGFFAARQFHHNFYRDFMEDADLDQGRPIVRNFVDRLAALAKEHEQRSS